MPASSDLLADEAAGGRSNERDLPVRERRVTANYPMEIRKDSEVGHTPYNGATRQIPATQQLDARNGNPIPTEEEEPLW